MVSLAGNIRFTQSFKSDAVDDHTIFWASRAGLLKRVMGNRRDVLDDEVMRLSDDMADAPEGCPSRRAAMVL